LHKSQINCNKITQKSGWDRQGPESPSNERLRLRIPTPRPWTQRNLCKSVEWSH